MWKGILMHRCTSLNYGSCHSFDSYNSLCTTNEDCLGFGSLGNVYVCSRSTFNSDSNVINFDNTLNSLLVVFITITMEGWTDVFIYLTQTFKSKIYINFIIINLWFLSLTLF